MCVLECISQRESVCVCRGTGSRNGVEGRGLELRVEGWRMYELESEYEITRRRYSSLLVVVTRYYSSSLLVITRRRYSSSSLLIVVITLYRAIHISIVLYILSNYTN